MATLAFRDPIHGFIEADELEAALIGTRPMQRLRSIRQLGLTHLVFPGAEHSRFGHALGTMHLAGRVYDTLAGADGTPLEAGPRARARRLVRAAALLHDLGHAPFSHWAEDLFEGGIDHEEMSRRLLGGREITAAFERYGQGIEARDVIRLLGDDLDGPERLLPPIVSGELDVDKMDYLLRDSLFCGVRYGNFDLDQVIATVRPLTDGDGDGHRLGIDAEGLHAVEGLILARYYMFTQVYFHVTGKALELHLNEWLHERGIAWSSDPERFLANDDGEMMTRMRRSDSLHARAITDRTHFRLAHETGEHLDADEKRAFEQRLEPLRERYGKSVLVSNSAKDPHRLGRGRVPVRQNGGQLVQLEDASHFVRHLRRIDRYRVYCSDDVYEDVRLALSA